MTTHLFFKKWFSGSTILIFWAHDLFLCVHDYGFPGPWYSRSWSPGAFLSENFKNTQISIEVSSVDIKPYFGPILLKENKSCLFEWHFVFDVCSNLILKTSSTKIIMKAFIHLLQNLLVDMDIVQYDTLLLFSCFQLKGYDYYITVVGPSGLRVLSRN